MTSPGGAGTRAIRLKFTGDAKGVEGASKDGQKAVKEWESSARESAAKVADAFKVGGAIIAGAMALGVAEAVRQGDIAGTVAAQLGRGSEGAAQIGAVAGKVYANNFGESFEDAAGAIKQVLQNGLVPEDAGDAEIQKLTEKLLTVGTVVEDEAGRVANAAKQLLRTGLAKNAEEAFDIIVRGQQEGVNKAGDFLDTLNEYGTQFRDIGLGGAQAVGILSQAVRAGARDSDIAADALKEFVIRAKDKSSADGMKALGLSADLMARRFSKGGPEAASALDQVFDKLRAVKDPVEQNRIAVALFGTQSEDLQKALLAIDPSAAAQSMGKVQGATQRAADTMGETAGAQIQGFIRGLKQGFVDWVGGKVIPVLREWWKWGQEHVIPMLQGIVRWVKENQAWLAPLAVAIGSMIVLYKAWTIATGVLTAANNLLKLAMLANPWGIVALAVGGLTAAVLFLWNKSEGFRNAVIAIWGALKGAFEAGRAWVVGKLQAIGQAFGGLSRAWGEVKDWIGHKIDDFVGFFAALPGRIGRGVAGMFKAIPNAFVDALNWVIDKWNNFSIPAVEIGGVQLTPHFDFPDIDKIPRLAKGGIGYGVTLVGEEGPELVDFGTRARVNNNSDTMDMLRNAGSGMKQTVMVTIPIDLGDGVRKVVRKEIQISNRNLKRRAGARLGTATA